MAFSSAFLPRQIISGLFLASLLEVSSLRIPWERTPDEQVLRPHERHHTRQLERQALPPPSPLGAAAHGEAG
jgi:hypothetical protein